MRHTGPPWMAFLWFGIELALVVAVCTGIDSRRQKAPATEAPAAMKVFPEWFSIAVAPPGTSGGGRILRRDSPEATKRLLEKIPSKELGHIVFDPLDHMTVGKKERIDAAITLGDVVDAVARFSGKGKPMVEGLRVASRMCVKLIGTDESGPRCQDHFSGAISLGSASLILRSGATGAAPAIPALEPALGSHSCGALSSAQVPPL